MAANTKPRGNFFQTLLLTAIFMIGFQLFCMNPNGRGAELSYGGKVLKTAPEIRTALVEANGALLDLTAANTLRPAYDKAVDLQLTEEKITPEAARALKTEAAVIVADTQLKAGKARNDTGRVRNAYHTLVGHWKGERELPYWRQPVAVTADARGAATGKWTPAALFDGISQELSARNKSELIWGFIPGGFALMEGLVRLTGGIPSFSYAFAGFLLALVVRAIIFPVAQKQIMYGRRMGLLVPQMNAIKEQYKEDPRESQQQVMKLYSRYGLNPAAGCLPALIQMPLFLTVYQCMLLYQFEFQNGTFLWINEASSLSTKGFVAPNLGQQDIILIVLYGISMVVSTLLQPISDPSQIKQQRYMGVGVSVLFTIMMFTGAFPVVAGFVLYWTFTNILATAQALRAHRLPLAPLVEVNTGPGGVRPGGGKWAQRMQDMMEQAQRQAEASRATDPPSGGKPGRPEIIPPKPKDGGTGGTGTPAKHKPKKRK